MLTIELPWPDTKLMPNRKNGKAWQSSKDAKERAFSDAYTLTYQALNKFRGEWYPLGGSVPLAITFCAPDGVRARADLDNLLAASKAAVDGIATALTINDRDFEPITLKRGAVVKGGVVRVEIGA